MTRPQPRRAMPACARRASRKQALRSTSRTAPQSASVIPSRRVASSGQAGQTERLLDLVGGAQQADGMTTSADVETSKPAPDVIEAVLARVDKGPAVVVGDTVWDVRAARDGGNYAVGLLSGGVSEAELREAGADRVFATTDELRQALDDLPIRASGPGSSRSTRA